MIFEGCSAACCRTQVKPLKFICVRCVALTLFQANAHWRKLNDVFQIIQNWLRRTTLPEFIKNQLHSGIYEVYHEVERWNEKHSVLFDEENEVENSQKLLFERVSRSDHLRLFYESIVWRPNKYEIDDRSTALAIIAKNCADWPQMQFQLACAYAFHHLLNNANFDRIRLRAFAKKLSGHCLYDFWFNVLRSNRSLERMFSSDGLAPEQLLSLAFQFAIVNGYFELVRFIWDNITDPQREFIGLLQWRRVCFKAKHREVMHFLCEKLCSINATALARITWNTFYQTLQNSLQDTDKEFRHDAVHKLRFLLENCCPHLCNALLSMENFRAVTDALIYNQCEVFTLFMGYLGAEQLHIVREHVDRIYDCKKNEITRRQRLLLRQHTFL